MEQKNNKRQWNKGQKPHNYKGGKSRFPKCINCGEQLSRIDAKRCKKCYLKDYPALKRNGELTKGRKYPNRKSSFPLSKTHKQKISESNKGQIPWIKGKHHTEKSKEKVRNALKGKYIGEKGSGWKGGITPLVYQIRNSFKYRQWISDVFTRDNFTCQECGKRGGEIHSHHIKLFSIIMEEHKIRTLDEAINCEEFWNINNGMTLCRSCHLKLHKIKLTKKWQK